MINRLQTGIITGTFAGIIMAFFYYGCQPKKNDPQHPNIVLIVADDLGYGDLSCFGSEEIKTPNLDQLAAEGVKLTQFYSGSAVCTPTRASILTGNYPLRFNIRQYFPRKGFLPAESITIPELLSHQGYYSAHIGKWHLGGLSMDQLNKRNAGVATEPGPLEHGFDHYLTMIEGDPNMPNLFESRKVLKEGGKYLISNDHRVPADSNYITTIITNEAIRIAREKSNTNTPFFLNLWYKIPHTPYERVPDPHYSTYEKSNYPEPENQNFHRGHNAIGDGILYNSMVSFLDAEIGRVIQSLEELGILEHTIVVFTSDNGPSYRGSTGPWTGSKADLHEGGIRVPTIIAWPGHLKEGTVNDLFAHTNDFLPTFCSLAGLNTDTIVSDGVNLMPQLTKNKPVERGLVFWQLDQAIDPWGNIWYPQPGGKPEPYSTCIVRNGDWKMHFDSITPVALYHVGNDSAEAVNQLGNHPDLESEMTKGLSEFLSAPRLDCGRTATDPRSL